MIVQDRLLSGISTKGVFNQVMKPPFFPVSIRDLNADIQFDKSLNNTFNIGSVKIETIPISHSGDGLGYKFSEDDKSFVFLTDNELGYDHPTSQGFNGYLKFVQNVDLLFHDGEYTENEYKRKVNWGHSSVEDVLDLAIQANVKKLGLFHHNQDRTDDQVDQIVNECQAVLKKKKLSIDCFGVACNMTFHL